MSISDYTPYIVGGITDGSLYGLAAMGLVLSYKTSGVFNVGYGAISAAAAFCFYSLHVSAGLAWGFAALLTVGVFGPLLGLAMEVLARGLARVPSSSRLVGTVGLLIGLLSLAQIIYGDQPKQLPVFLPDGRAFRVGGANVTWAQLITLLLGTGAAVALYVFFRRTRTGRAMRAVVDDPDLLDMTGLAPVAIRRRAWIISCAFAAMAGPLLATKESVDAVLLSLLVIQAFGAASAGFFTSLPLAFVGGIGVGVLQELTTKQISGHLSLQNLDVAVPFLVLFLVLIFAPRAKLAEVGRAVKLKVPPPSRLSPRTQTVGALLVIALLAIVPYVVDTKLPIWDAALPYALVLMSLGLLVRTSGQVSLCQVGLMAVGAAAGGHLLQSHVPWGIALIVSGLVAVPVGAIVAIPAIRLSGLYLGLATLGVGVLLDKFFYTQSFMFGVTGGLHAPRPHVLGLQTDKGYWYVMLAIVVACAGVVTLIERSRLGRLLRGLGDAPTALTTAGLDINVTKVIVFCVAALLAGLGGALSASLNEQIDGSSFPYLYSLILLAVMAIAGRATVPTAIVGALAYQVLPGYIGNATFSQWLQVAFGVGAIVAALLSSGGASVARLQQYVTATGRERPGPLVARLSTTRRPVPSA
ncbi:MAG TPA: ABC transporter permease [Mycobacteriales bacterium]|nr:ABC transporter permease [Mycobacteriales bacterium]